MIKIQNSFITECTVPLGMESRSISDAQITASSQLDGNHSAVQGRLHFQTVGNNAGGWSALTSDANQWLQVDFGSYTHVTQVATQGVNGVDEWVTRYKLQYSDNGLTYKFYQKTGDTSVTVRFIHIQGIFLTELTSNRNKSFHKWKYTFANTVT